MFRTRDPRTEVEAHRVIVFTLAPVRATRLLGLGAVPAPTVLPEPSPAPRGLFSRLVTR